jgi:type I restriction enzyme, S subunit
MSKNNENMLVPKLRFPEFLNNGEWKTNTLDEIAEFLKGKGVSKADVEEKGKLPCIRYGELYTHYREVIKEIKSFTNLSEDDLVLSEEDDVIIPSSGETKEDIATASCVKIKGVALGGDLNILRSKLDGEFLAYYISHGVKKSISKIAQGDAVVHLYSTQLKKLLINVPINKEQQKKIASCLSSLDAVINAENQKLNVLKEYKKGLLQNLLPQEGETFPKFRFKEFENSGDWEIKTLGEIGEPLMCKRIFKEETTPNPNDGVPFYKIGTFGRVADSYITKEIYEEYKSKYSFPNIGDILISASGTIGRLVIYDGAPAFFQDSNIIWLGHDEKIILNRFLFYCYSNLRWQTSDGGVISRLYNSDFKRMTICFPENQTEQEKIADTLSSLDTLINNQSQKIEALNLHKKGLLQGLFPTISNEE